MRHRLLLTLIGMAAMTGLVMAQGTSQRLNPVIELLTQKKPVFGLYAPSNRRPGRPGGPGGAPGAPAAPAAPEAPPKSPTELAKDAVAYKSSDFVFDGSMEGGLERALPAFTALMSGLQSAGALSKAPHRLTHPVIVKTPELGEPTIHADIATTA